MTSSEYAVDMVKPPKGFIIVSIPIPAPPPRPPTILELMLLLTFFLRYGADVDPGPNLLAFQLKDMPDDVNAYWMWMHLRPWS